MADTHDTEQSPLLAALYPGLDEARLAQLAAYRERLATAGLNLVSAGDREVIERRHIAESLELGRALEERGLLPEGARVLDLGAGGGLPGIPIRVAWPGVRLTLLESAGKKCRFLEEVCRDLGLADVTVLEGRAETLAHDEAHRERYDVVLARAVAPLPVLTEYALPFLRAGGRLAALKGSAASREVAASGGALRELGGRLAETAPFEPPQGVRQTLVLIEKVAATPERYPRRAGVPSKRPLQ